jgi:hypothetical protein
MQNRCTRETRKAADLGPHGQHGYSLGPTMHHYRCQNVYILVTARKHIVDTLELFPHNYQMPQVSSTERLLMAANDMTGALQNPHRGPHGFSSYLQTQIMTSYVPRDSSSACQGRHTPRPLSLFNPNLELARTHQAANEITDDNSHPRHPQCAITSVGQT